MDYQTNQPPETTPNKDKIIAALKEHLWRHLHAEASIHGAKNDKARKYANNQIETIIKKAGEL